MKTFALALGAGGARGLAHIAVFEALDELGVKPVAISGSSIGAVMGAAYAAGMSPRALRRHVIAMVQDRATLIRRLLGARAAGFAWSSLLRVPFGHNPVLLDADKFCAAFLPEAVPEDFSALAIPLLVIASDLYGQAEVVFSEGPLRPAIAASMAIPGLVQPVEHEGRVLVDGAAVDPLPFTQLAGRADVVVAVDCSAGPREKAAVPEAWDSVFATITLMGNTIVAEKLQRVRPDLLIRPNVAIFGLLDFLQAIAIIRAGEAIKDEIKRDLAALLKD
ncbi:MAG: patatin-like phospholipase family protein [Rhodoplanes sp.]|uniref:patatin-like phospholipase family protein n=1 Tax=Rhodoplanes sp. TaxID=1968906 RepID=UPI0017B98779|nr:patatin-like phospholipase family protein [Rhodoplanes sp.]NVO16789.1 patatin-like phospholipase family protein [Rhodoplanes sp.]